MNDPVAEFLAKGGKITKVPAGVAAYDINDIYDAARNGGRAVAIAKREAEASDKYWIASDNSWETYQNEGTADYTENDSRHPR
jgi:hypothetical protein